MIALKVRKESKQTTRGSKMNKVTAEVMRVETIAEAKELIRKKNESIENSPDKNKIRQDIIMQAKKCITYQKLKDATILTLPAKMCCGQIVCLAVCPATLII